MFRISLARLFSPVNDHLDVTSLSLSKYRLSLKRNEKYSQLFKVWAALLQLTNTLISLLF